MNWLDVLALDEAALNLAIESVIYRREWEQVPRICINDRWIEGPCWMERGRDPAHPPAGYSAAIRPTPHTASWDCTMALATRFHLCQQYLPDAQRWLYCAAGVVWADKIMVQGDDPQALRVALCRLALWAKLQQKEAL